MNQSSFASFQDNAKWKDSSADGYLKSQNEVKENEGSQLEKIQNSFAVSNVRKMEIAHKIEEIVTSMLKELSRGCTPRIQVPKRVWQNTIYNRQTRRLELKTMENTSLECTELKLSRNSLKPFGLFKNQRVTDTAIENISCMLDVPRNNLNLVGSYKGMVVGRISFYENGVFVDCNKLGIKGKNIVALPEQMADIRLEVKFILVIEKDTTLQRLAEDGFHEKYSCLLVTGKGVPDFATRLFLKRLEVFQVPMVALVDCDPYGLEIYMAYTIGTKSSAYDSGNLTIPSIKWLGVHPTDIKKYAIPLEYLIPLSAEDRKRGQLMLQRDSVQSNPTWKAQLELMLESGYKAEIQALQMTSVSYLSDMYLPTKLQRGDWL